MKCDSRIDFLIIDIDGNDYHILESVLSYGYKPVSIMIEYNSSFPPPKEFILPYNELFVWQNDDFYGASLTSLVKLAKQYNYELIHCTKGGDNAFFVDEKFYKTFNIINNLDKKMYQLPRYGKNGRTILGKGHPVSKNNASRFQILLSKFRYLIMFPIRSVLSLYTEKGKR